MPLLAPPPALPTTLRFIGSRLLHRLRGGPGVGLSPRDFEQQVAVLQAALGPALAGVERLRVPAAASGVRSRTRLARGERVTVLAGGAVYASRLFDVGFAPDQGLWLRPDEGEAPVRVLGAPGRSFTVEQAGPLWFVAKPPGEFLDPQGRPDPAVPRRGAHGDYRVAILRWNGMPSAASLATARGIAPDAFADRPDPSPPGWSPLWRLGRNRIVSVDAPEQALCCATHGDVTILRHPLSRPLDASTRLRWQWKVENLPSRLPEHLPPTHDYFSMALEFDNGQDLTWMWSCALPVDTVFRCPLPWWDQRETHWVVRSGEQDWNRWLDEERAVLADYQSAIGGEPPRAVVAVWLISNSAFQRQAARCWYRGIALSDARGRVELPAGG